MARSRNPAHREALLAAATRALAEHGPGASTALIAKEAGVSTGTLFVYFDTKATLVNELYIELKSEMAHVATGDLPFDAAPREQLRHMWDRWVAWATTYPAKRRALAHLGIADDLTDGSRLAVHDAYSGISAIVERIVRQGPMRDARLSFALTLMSSITDAAIDDLIQTPDPTGSRGDLAFDAMWRVLAG